MIARVIGLVPEHTPTQRLSALTRLYVILAIVFCGIYAALAYVFVSAPDYARSGPGDLAHALANTAPIPPEVIAGAKSQQRTFPRYAVAGAPVSDAAGTFWVLYDVRETGSLSAVRFIDSAGAPMTDLARIKASGAWPNYGLIKNPEDWITGFIALAGIAFAIVRWAPLSAVRGVLAATQRARTDAARLFGSDAFVLLALATVVGLPALIFAPGWNGWRKWVWLYRWTLVFVGLIVAGFLIAAWGTAGDLAARAATTTIAGGAAVLWLFGLRVLKPAGLARAEELAGGRITPREEVALVGQLRGAAGFSGPPNAATVSAADVPTASAGSSGLSAGSGSSGLSALAPADRAGVSAFQAVTPDRCPNFSKVGGMEEVKKRLRETVGLLLAFPDEALTFKVAFNGILLYGPPGTGKTFIARATAGEFGCNFVSVGSSEIVSAYRGQSAKRIDDAFAFAAANAPCVLFFDEFDAIARRRQDNVLSGEDRQTLDQLLRALETVRNRPEIVVMAATNDLDALDPAVIRPGRFDVRIRVDLPDRDARVAIVRAQLAERPVGPDIDPVAVAEATEGLSAAAIAAAINRAALAVLNEVTTGTAGRQIRQADVVAALKAAGGQDRPTPSDWTWEQLILADKTKRELQELQRLIEDPERARRFGITPPTGALLYGPPGTGKTTIARVLAAQAKTSFYPIKGSDLISKWVGESEKNMAQLFARARENRPSIIFLDEIDAIAPRRSASAGSGFADRTVNQLLQEIDGLGSTPGVFVLGATNRPDMLDDALLRGGRLGRKIEIPLPDQQQRILLLRQFVARMPISSDVNVADLALETRDLSGADLQALCQEAAVQSLMRQSDLEHGEVTRSDFAAALAARRGPQ
jgi:transitional endoplasmic reticulum ATPase